MTERNFYTMSSLCLHLYSLRILKEDTLFLSLTLKSSTGYDKFYQFYKKFERFMYHTLLLSSNAVPFEILNSDELVTSYTFDSEKNTGICHGFPIDTGLTVQELKLQPSTGCSFSLFESQETKSLNQMVIVLLCSYIKELSLLSSSEKEICRKDASRYKDLLTCLETKDQYAYQDLLLHSGRPVSSYDGPFRFLPLYNDHISRKTNHYVRLASSLETITRNN